MPNKRNWMYRKPGEKAKREEYFQGVEEFLEFAFAHTDCVRDNKIRCPSKKCDFFNYESREAVQLCLLKHGFIPNYKRWVRHGELHEEIEMDENMTEVGDNWPKEMVMDAAGPEFDPLNADPNMESKRFYDIFNASDEALWEGCEKHSKLSATTRLLHLKSEHVLSNKCINDFLSFIKECLPQDNKLPETYYRCKVMMKELGLPYEKIHACENDCVLFWKDYSTLTTCPICGESRYKEVEKIKGKKCKPIPRKVLRYFPLIARLIRLYLSSKTAESMRWHKERRCDVTGELRHPADGEAWKDFDRTYPDFAEDVRNIRLGLATDGFNPFGHSSKPHSTWPVFLVPYNLPPWMCMKEAYMFLTLIIPGPKSPGRELDVYLQPLIHELKTLWDVGVDTYDSYSKKNFKMRAAVLWTISDFPAYGMLSGWSTHGKLSCPVCMDASVAFNLKEGRKPCYFGCHRRWLKRTHRFRSEKTKFNNKSEYKLVPGRKSGEQVLDYVSQFESITLGKGENSDDKTPGFGDVHNWTKKSIFFQLPYWSSLLIRHNLDVMHIEKNVFDNVFYTVMNVKGKSKDHLKARKDLESLNIRSELHAFQGSNGNWILPKASYTLNNEQVKQVYQWLGSLKVPDGYAGNISRSFKSDDYKFSGLKSHDCHVLMERFLSVAFQDFLPKSVWEPLHALSQFFRDICSKVYKEDELDKLESNIVETLCRLETIFPPSFFDTMEHLPVHLVFEAKVGGPVQYRWMYPFERCMRKLKRKVTNKACPEGSIAEAYRIEELVNFCSMYFDVNVRTKFNKPDRHDDGGVVEANGRLPIFTFQGRPIGAGKCRYLEENEYYAALLYILSNCREVYDFINEHHSLIEDQYPNMKIEEREKHHNSTFVKWFQTRVENDDTVDPRLKILARGPSREVQCYDVFNANGFRFHTKRLEPRKATQNSGVFVKGTIYDDNELDYYGCLLEVLRVEFAGEGNTIFLFKCDWYDNEKGVSIDKYGLTKVNINSKLKSFEPFVFASQAVQVFYARPVSRKNRDWYTAILTKARNTYDVVENEVEETYQEDVATALNIFDNDENLVLRDVIGQDEEVDVEGEEEVDSDADDVEEEEEFHSSSEDSDEDEENHDVSGGDDDFGGSGDDDNDDDDDF